MREEREIQLWGGLECTVNRVGDRYHDQFEKSGHLGRPEDLERVADLGIRTLRYPILWERTAPDSPDRLDWSFADERLQRLRQRNVAPIAGLVHHGSGPRYTNLLDDGFATGLAKHALAVAERYPWIDAYTPVNEPLTTARFSALYGHWYPHATDPLSFAKALLNQVKATVLSMEAIRRVNPRAQLVQTDDLGKTHTTRPLSYQADFDNERRWLTWDLLGGRVDRFHPMWDELVGSGIGEHELGWFLDHVCPPDVVGVNYYLTSERFLDHRIDRYPAETHGTNDFDQFADVEAIRVLADGIDGPSALLNEAWNRYRLPIAVTECHLGCTREEQVRWLRYVWTEAQRSRDEGVDVRAVTVWSMFGAHDWCSLLTCDRNRYEPGVFDLRSPQPRPTALANAVAALASGQTLPTEGEGWWERPIRLIYPPVLTGKGIGTESAKGNEVKRRPLLIVGGQNGLEKTFAALCELRGLGSVLLEQGDIDLWDTASVRQALEGLQPWAVVCTQSNADRQGDRSVTAMAALAAECAKVGAKLVVFSSPSVFDGRKSTPYVESDSATPFDDQGRADLLLEEVVLNGGPSTMVVRMGALFGSDDRSGHVQRHLRALLRGKPFMAASDVVFSPTSMSDLVNATLDLLLDGVEGLIHLANVRKISVADFVRSVAEHAGLDGSLVVEAPHVHLSPKHARSLNTALASERAWVMPLLEDALVRSLPPMLMDVNAERAPYLS